MNLYLFDKNEIILFSLPTKKVGNFWMTDNKGHNVINVKADNNEWLITPSVNSKIMVGDKYVDSAVLQLGGFYVIELNSYKYILYVRYAIDNSFTQYKISARIRFGVGFDRSAGIFFDNGFLMGNLILLDWNGERWTLKRENNSTVYVNNMIVKQEEYNLINGDVLNIFGFKIVFSGDNLFINNPFGNLKVDSSILTLVDKFVNNVVTMEEIPDKPRYQDDEYFLKSPRINRVIETYNMNIDSPPQKIDEKGMPLIYTLGPMFTMGASSVVSITEILSNVSSGEKTWSQVAPSLIISGAMLCTMLVWPFLTRMYEKKMRRANEVKRRKKYRAYILSKEKELSDEYNRQLEIINENLLSCEVCYDTILGKKRTLWERKIEQSDFLTVRVGRGQIPMDAKISYHRADFSMDDDKLINLLENFVKRYEILNNVPIGYSFSDNNLTAINGLYPKYLYFTYNVLLQFMAYHSYDNLKIVLFTDKEKINRWSFLRESMYTFTDDMELRFIATSIDEMQTISAYLEKILINRRNLVSNTGNNKNLFRGFNCYYLILIDDIDSSRRVEIVDDVLKEKDNYGFSIIVLEDKLSKIPSQVTNFISIGDKTSGILNNDVVSNSQIKFNDEVAYDFNMDSCTYVLSNLPVYIESNAGLNIPSLVTFLEMYGVGDVEQLNSLNRWKENDPVKSLKAMIGVNEQCEPFILDLHEKAHGPHGLIAGMTGSGKSELLITYILSMAVNYSPEEVSFVLIDYKGGGLAGAFENKELGIKLPHIVGTITNLDKTEINRALSSINSELRSRQEKFNEVRDKTGESTIDIYKYQKMYREGVVSEPMPHLIIVSDEFAELKAQQPDFMDDLISTARIGRSLGVHLILATQKPSGVVNAQIWSNSKFKICLKVQDKEDSMEMIKRSEAAELKDVGRFYLQVGYNEFFALGQAAWAGAPYIPSREYKRQVDKNIYFIDNIGNPYKAIENNRNKLNYVSNGEELNSILKYVISISNELKLKLKPLWLERISPVIYLSNLKKKYNYQKTNFVVNPIIGEYDDPTNQRQGLLTLPITMNGNTLIYGISDSGRDELMQSLVYSIISEYSASEVNLYLVDFGAETLINFANAPQVGDVVLYSDDEKMKNLVRLLMSELNRRKKKFVSYNGNYYDYLKMSGRSLANIVVIINVLEVFNDNYLVLFDRLFTVIRDGSKYGINFILTTTSQNSVRFKIIQSCKQVLCLQLANDNEYRDIFGKTGGIIPSRNIGRGLVKIDGCVCEFQSASIVSDDEKYDTIKKTIDELNAKTTKRAVKIPVMPDVVKLSMLVNGYTGISDVPIGINKDTLKNIGFDFSKNAINVISSSDMSNMFKFMKNFLKTLEVKNSFNKVVIDASGFFDTFKYNMKLFTSQFNEIVALLKNIDEAIYKDLVNNGMNVRSLSKYPTDLCILVGFDKFYAKLDDAHKKIFKEILNHQKDCLKIIFIFVDVPSSFKKYEYEEWYKSAVNVNNGIWIGAGLTQQFVIRLIAQNNKLSSITEEYGIVVKNGVPVLVKLMNEFNDF